VLERAGETEFWLHFDDIRVHHGNLMMFCIVYSVDILQQTNCNRWSSPQSSVLLSFSKIPPPLFWKPKPHFRCHRSSPLVHILSHYSILSHLLSVVAVLLLWLRLQLYL